jgi:hypothetical protein
MPWLRLPGFKPAENVNGPTSAANANAAGSAPFAPASFYLGGLKPEQLEEGDEVALLVKSKPRRDRDEAGRGGGRGGVRRGQRGGRGGHRGSYRQGTLITNSKLLLT